MGKVIGITGRVGSGKSMAQEIILTSFSCLCIDLDKVGHDVLELSHVKKKLKDVFGSDVFNEEGTIIRKVLGKIVFSSAEKLIQLNDIVHPEIKKITFNTINEQRSENMIVVGALLEEIKISDMCHSIVTIDASDDNIMTHIGGKSIILNSQRSRQEYIRSAHYFIENTYDESFKNKCISLFQTLFLGDR